MTSLPSVLGESWISRDIIDDLNAICDCGGRLAGSESEANARTYVSSRLDEIGGKRADFAFDYTGLVPESASVRLFPRQILDAIALPGSPSAEKVELEVVDL